MVRRFSSDTLAVPFRKRETVAGETPAALATWYRVLVLLSTFFMKRSGLIQDRLLLEVYHRYSPAKHGKRVAMKIFQRMVVVEIQQAQ